MRPHPLSPHPGPDAYRDLPALLDDVEGGAKAANVQLSLHETYADVAPVRRSEEGVSAYVAITRGCNNMYSFCIVPFTRGRERSRPAASIEDEVRMLAEQGFQEVPRPLPACLQGRRLFIYIMLRAFDVDIQRCLSERCLP